MKKDCKDQEQSCRLNTCLFFSATKLSREFSKIGEDAFKPIGLSPSHAMLLYILNLTDEMQQKELGERLTLTPSTITRFIEKLESSGHVVKRAEGKNVFVRTTLQGKALQGEIINAWNSLHHLYDGILSEEETQQFISISNKLLEKLGQ